MESRSPIPLGGTTFGTFEGYRDGLGSAYVLSNRLFFRSGAAPSAFGAFADTAAQGFYFDDLFYSVANQSAPAIRLAAYATGFEPGFSAGSIQGQEVWSGGTIPISASIDQTVDLSGINPRTGTGAWRISNNTSLGNHNGNFAGWVFGPGLPVSAGQPSSGAAADQFTATLWFRSASASADGSNIEIDLGSALGDDRNTFLALTNRADGVTAVCSFGPVSPTERPATSVPPPSSPRESHAASGTASTSSPTSTMGRRTTPSNTALDGVPLANPRGGTTFGTFEGFRDGLGSRVCPEQPPVLPLGRSPECLWRVRRHGRPGLLLRRPVLLRREPVGAGHSLAAYATGFEPPAIPAPDLTISKTHVGDFTQGQIGAQFTVTVTNSGTPSTIGLVTLTDNVPTGLTPTAASGAGWTCSVSGRNGHLHA